MYRHTLQWRLIAARAVKLYVFALAFGECKTFFCRAIIDRPYLVTAKTLYFAPCYPHSMSLRGRRPGNQSPTLCFANRGEVGRGLAPAGHLNAERTEIAANSCRQPLSLRARSAWQSPLYALRLPKHFRRIRTALPGDCEAYGLAMTVVYWGGWVRRFHCGTLSAQSADCARRRLMRNAGGNVTTRKR